jgi:hypothetical protein
VTVLRTALYVAHRVADYPKGFVDDASLRLGLGKPTKGATYTQATCSQCGAAVWVGRSGIEAKAIICWRCHG